MEKASGSKQILSGREEEIWMMENAHRMECNTSEFRIFVLFIKIAEKEYLCTEVILRPVSWRKCQ